MPHYWLLLSGPESYHVDELFKEQREVWDGVFGAVAQKHIAAAEKGDRVLGYHTAPEKGVHCGLRAARAPHQNPELKDRNLVLGVALVKKLKRTVPLAELRKNPKLRRMRLFQFFRLIAVSPLTAAECKETPASTPARPRLGTHQDNYQKTRSPPSRAFGVHLL